MLSALNGTMGSGLALLRQSGASSQQTASPDASAVTATNASPGSPRVAGFNSVDQIFSILNAAHKQALATSAASVTASAAYRVQTADATSSVGVSVTISTPSMTQQIASAVAQVNAMISEINPQDLPNPQILPPQSANANDAYVVTFGDGTGALTQPQSLGLPNGLPPPTTIAQALEQLSESSVAGVAAAASSLAGRLLPSADGKAAGFMSTAAEMATYNIAGGGSVTGDAIALVNELRDVNILSVAESMIGTTPALDAAAQADAAKYFANTYNGSFTLVKAPYVPATTANYERNGVSGFAGGPGSTTDVWYVVFPQPTVSVSVAAETTTANSTGK